MEKLKCGNYCIDIQDYVVGLQFVYIDIKFKNKEEMNRFINFYKNHTVEFGYFDYEIDGEEYNGHCGQFLYDKELNARIVMYINKGEEIDYFSIDTFRDKVAESIVAVNTAISDLCDLISEKKNKERLAKIKENISLYSDKNYFYHYVDDLEKHLKSEKQTLEDLRKEN